MVKPVEHCERLLRSVQNSRRQFMSGSLALGVAAPAALALAGKAQAAVPKDDRLFPELAPEGGAAVSERAENRAMIEALRALGREMKGRPGDRDLKNPRIPAGYTYLGQFIVHDVVHSAGEAGARANLRSPFLDLDSLYGAGPEVHPFLYRRSMRTGELTELSLGHMRESKDVGKIRFPDRDLPRCGVPSYGAFVGASTLDPGYAGIIEARNDQNLMVGQTHVALARFHNAVVGKPPRSLAAARQQVVRHFQHLVLHDFLSRVAGEAAVQSRLTSPELRLTPRGEAPAVPLEFSLAASRFGHAMVRDLYVLNRVSINGSDLTPLNHLFELTAPHGSVKPPVGADWAIDWRRFFEIDPLQPELINPSSRIGTSIPELLVDKFELPQVTLVGGYLAGLPSGQAVARRLEVEPLSSAQIAGAGGRLSEAVRRSGFDRETPLWFYLMREAEVLGDRGQRLGPVAARIVVDVLVSLLEDDPDSILNQPGGWQPSLGDLPGRFAMGDLLKIAGLDGEPAF